MLDLRPDAVGRALPRVFLTPGHGGSHALNAVVAIAVIAAAVIVPGPALAGLVVLTVGALLVAARPSLVLAGLVLMAEELDRATPVGGDAASVVLLGNWAWYLGLGNVRLVVYLAAAAAAVVAVRGIDPAGATRRPLAQRTAAEACIAGLAVWAVGLSLAQSPGLTPGAVEAAVVAATPFLLLLAGAVAGRELAVRTAPGTVQCRVLGGALVYKAAVALAVAATGAGIAINGRRLLVYYDSSLPVLAGALLVAALVSERLSTRTRVALVGASAVVLGLSFRRNAWLFAVVALVVAAVLRRGPVVRRLLAIAAVLAVVGSVLAPNVLGAVADRATSATAELREVDGRRGSAAQHVGDIEIGLELARGAGLDGVGVRSTQLPGLAAERSDKLYVHNELLQTWLRFGVPGLLLLTAALVLLVRLGIGTLRRSHDVVALAAAALGVCLVVPLFTAPFLTTTYRWPTMVGLALGVLAQHRSEP